MKYIVMAIGMAVSLSVFAATTPTPPGACKIDSQEYGFCKKKCGDQKANLISCQISGVSAIPPKCVCGK